MIGVAFLYVDQLKPENLQSRLITLESRRPATFSFFPGKEQMGYRGLKVKLLAWNGFFI
jgi:hypothetical protein